MESLNYRATYDGTLVASGEGVVTVTVYGFAQTLVSRSGIVAPQKEVKQALRFGVNESMYLNADEFLWVFGNLTVGVLADNPAAGDE